MFIEREASPNAPKASSNWAVGSKLRTPYPLPHFLSCQDACASDSAQHKQCAHCCDAHCTPLPPPFPGCKKTHLPLSNCLQFNPSLRTCLAAGSQLHCAADEWTSRQSSTGTAETASCSHGSHVSSHYRHLLDATSGRFRQMRPVYRTWRQSQVKSSNCVTTIISR